MSLLGVVLVGLVMLTGLAGTVVPVWPGLALVWAAGLVYGLIAGFGTVGRVAFAAMSVLALVGTVAKLVLPHRGGTRRGAPTTSLLAGLVGAVVGFVVIPVLGLPVGAVGGVWLAETARLRDPRAAWQVTVGVVIGFGLGALVELGVGVMMIGCWIAWVLLGR
ncbi:MAG TPA: DUF456 domain-containing protein [Egibacteraceae bacterium]|nr:DUF456 domain-containing protein [Egibacteraceae bacterium]